MDEIKNMQLPKVNKRRQQCQEMANKLHIAITKAIEAVEADNNYEFECYERDKVLIEMVVDNHEAYLKTKFGASRL